MLWRFAAARVDSETAERRAQQLIAITFWLLATYVTVDATIALAGGDHPASSPVGIGLSIVTLIAMPLLANAKASVAGQLDSHAGHSESRQNMLCAYLSAALLDRAHAQRRIRVVVGRPDHRAGHRRRRRTRRTRELARRELLHHRRLLLTHPPGASSTARPRQRAALLASGSSLRALARSSGTESIPTSQVDAVISSGIYRSQDRAEREHPGCAIWKQFKKHNRVHAIPPCGGPLVDEAV